MSSFYLFTEEELIDLYHSIYNHPRIMAKKLKLTVKQVKLLKSWAINEAVFRKLIKQGDEEANKYNKISNRIFSEMDYSTRQLIFPDYFYIR